MKKKFKVALMVDSGEFSAWRRGTSVDLDRYIAYIQENKDFIFSYVAVDKIPGQFGKKKTQAEVENSAKVGYNNLEKMWKAGLQPIPVFHQGERWYWLEKMLADKIPYIGISSSKDLWATEQQKWLDQVFTLLTNAKGEPLVKTHGFGITRPGFIFRYPFFSCDSTAWSLAPGYGSVLIPPLDRKGIHQYLKQPTKIVLSGVKHKSPSSQRKQFEGLSGLHKDAIEKFLKELADLTMGEVRYGTNFRRECMLLYYRHLGEALSNVRFKEHKKMFLYEFKDLEHKPVRFDHLHIMFATNLNKEWSTIMTQIGCEDRLLSYWELKDKPSKVLQDYVLNGSHAEYDRKMPKVSWDSEAYKNYRRLKLLELEAKQHAEDGTV
jgi:hypothetical protein